MRESNRRDASYSVVNVTQANLAEVSGWPATGTNLGLNWPGKGQSQRSRSLRAGDTINLTIWDSQENSLLTSIEQRAVPMNGLLISPQGTIFVPYIDEVKIVGMSPEQARSDIQSRLMQIAPSAQVQLAVDPGDQNVIELVSGVQKPGRYPLASRGVTILSALAEGGGIPDGMRNPVVRLQRGGESYATLAQEIYRSPDQDILLRGGDRIVVESDPRSFIILGAAGAERTVPFEKPRHTLMEALSLGGGLLDSRADIRAVLVLRKYAPSLVRSDGKGPDRTQVVFAFDLSSGDGLFAARSFAIHPDDVVLATESPLPVAGSLLGLFGSALGISQRL
ncbi:MAG: polysaccharide export protein [Rhodobacteraceae bacterium]|nr:polysaccharide export protein [Paracoccaceae bacterium]